MEKKVIITLSRVFQGNHSRKGEPTKFKENLAAGNKKHTIRENYALWKHNLDKVTNGNFVLSIRQWTGATVQLAAMRDKALQGRCGLPTDNDAV